jgi:hypothetical protein
MRVTNIDADIDDYRDYVRVKAERDEFLAALKAARVQLALAAHMVEQAIAKAERE